MAKKKSWSKKPVRARRSKNEVTDKLKKKPLKKSPKTIRKQSKIDVKKDLWNKAPTLAE